MESLGLILSCNPPPSASVYTFTLGLVCLTSVLVSGLVILAILVVPFFWLPRWYYIGTTKEIGLSGYLSNKINGVPGLKPYVHRVRQLVLEVAKLRCGGGGGNRTRVRELSAFGYYMLSRVYLLTAYAPTDRIIKQRALLVSSYHLEHLIRLSYEI